MCEYLCFVMMVQTARNELQKRVSALVVEKDSLTEENQSSERQVLELKEHVKMLKVRTSPCP